MLFVDSEAITTVVSVGGEISARYLVLMMTARGYESVMCVFYEKKRQETLYNSKLAPCTRYYLKQDAPFSNSRTHFRPGHLFLYAP